MKLRKLKNKVNITGEIAGEPKMTNINGKSAVEVLINANGVITCYYYSDENVFKKYEVGSKIILIGHVEAKDDMIVPIIEEYKVKDKKGVR